MKKLICKLFGHKWGEWKESPRSLWYLPGQQRRCSRCDKLDTYRDFQRCFAVGDTIRIKMPESFNMRDLLP